MSATRFFFDSQVLDFAPQIKDAAFDLDLVHPIPRFEVEAGGACQEPHKMRQGYAHYAHPCATASRISPCRRLLAPLAGIGWPQGSPGSRAIPLAFRCIPVRPDSCTGRRTQTLCRHRTAGTDARRTVVGPMLSASNDRCRVAAYAGFSLPFNRLTRPLFAVFGRARCETPPRTSLLPQLPEERNNSLPHGKSKR